MPREGDECSASVDIPQMDGAVLTPSSECSAIRTERYAIDSPSI